MNIQPPYKKDLVLIGGGHSHVAVIKQWGMKPLPAIRVTLVSDDTYTPYSGMLPGLIAGHYSIDDCYIDLRKLCQWAGIRFIRSAVSHLDLVTKEIVCHQYPSLRYDLLSINIGSQPALHTISGALSYGYAVKPVSKFLSHWHQWLNSVPTTNTNQPQNIIVVGGGAAGIEVLLAMHYHLQNNTQIKANFILICSDKNILASHNKRVQNFFHNYLSILGIKIITENKVTSATANQLLLNSGKSLDADFIAWAVNAGAQSWLADSGLNCDSKGFIQVDKFLRSISHPEVFAAGDSAAFTPTPLPKAGVYAVRQGSVLTDNLIATLKQRSLRPYKPQHHFLSLLTTGRRHAVASRGPLFIEGKWVWYWKNYIDRRFMARFSPAPMVTNNDTDDNINEKMRCGGCGAKVSRNILQKVLSQLDIRTNADIVSGQGDDAAIINPPAGVYWVQSVDFFRSFIDDPYLFGRIAANHSLGDIYAMGARSHSALVTVVIPYSQASIMQETLLHVMRGALKTLDDENTVLIGGHSGEGSELALGLTANGTLMPGQALTKTGLNHNDDLILTKPLGTGVLLAANMAARCQGRWLDNAFTFMLQSNRTAAIILKNYGARSCTDVTGFGLLGHLHEMLTASQCGATLRFNAIPILEGALQCSAQGVQSTLYTANKQSSSCHNYTGYHPAFPLLFDPQTAGGLLAGVPAHQTKNCLQALTDTGYIAAKIGTVDKLAPINSVTLNE
ncbi:MAG: selenide, water dikinase SelD [Coxiellaceae bacterium]|nr:selenide, water dikinase SelD [Coxiellaceae bacterium]MDP1950532.1 selenide, water dikinase SelD [Nitrosomonas sp.]